MEVEEMQVVDDDYQHLRLLSISHYLWAAFQLLTGFLSFFFIGIVTSFFYNRSRPPPTWFGSLTAELRAIIVVSAISCALLSITAGRFLGQRRHHTFCVAISVVNCMCMPFGTLLGVFSLMVLQRPGVKQLFSLASGRPPTTGDETH